MKYLTIIAVLFCFACNLSDENQNGNRNNTAGQPSENCVTYCDDAATICRGDNELYDNDEDCLEACEDFPDDSEQPIETALTGDTIQCRLYHLESSGVDPDTHCSHSSETSIPGKCVDEITPCDRYCGIVVENCPALFENIEQCLGACGTIPEDGEANEESGNTVQCRITYANRAVGDMTNCTDASVNETILCVD